MFRHLFDTIIFVSSDNKIMVLVMISQSVIYFWKVTEAGASHLTAVIQKRVFQITFSSKSLLSSKMYLCCCKAAT